MYTALGPAVTSLTMVAWSLNQGMTTQSLLDGVIRIPLLLPGYFFLPLHLEKFTIALSLLLAVAVLSLWALQKRTDQYDRWIVAARFLIGVGMLNLVLRNYFFVFPVLSLLPIVLIPSRRLTRAPQEQFARVFVTLLAAGQMLQCYPVAGSQLNVSLAPTLLWCFLCIADGLQAVSSLLQEKARSKAALLPKDHFSWMPGSPSHWW